MNSIQIEISKNILYCRLIKHVGILPLCSQQNQHALADIE